jgi:hypothetical protein
MAVAHIFDGHRTKHISLLWMIDTPFVVTLQHQYSH